MKLPNPAKILRDGKALALKREEATEILKERLRHAFDRKNKEARQVFTEMLKKKGIQPIQLFRLSQEVGKEKEVLIKWERKIGQEGKALTLADVQDRSVFSKILIIVRELHAEDIAGDILFDQAAKLVIEEILLHP